MSFNPNRFLNTVILAVVCAVPTIVTMGAALPFIAFCLAIAGCIALCHQDTEVNHGIKVAFHWRPVLWNLGFLIVWSLVPGFNVTWDSDLSTSYLLWAQCTLGGFIVGIVACALIRACQFTLTKWRKFGKRLSGA